jgi:4-hydroxy 2-oxovalerate aldolase
MHIKILDASLRDGGHRTDFHFTDDDLSNILKPLDDSLVEYIEIGYRNGALHPVNHLGRAGTCNKDYLLLCRSLIKKAQIAVMVHPTHVTKDDLQELSDCGVTLLRICLAKGALASTLPVILLATSLHLKVSVNIIHMSYYTPIELDELIKQLSPYQPDIIYLADSNGTMQPQHIKSLYDRYINHYPIAFGFHAHDNIGLAQTNALAAIDAGVTYIDASLAGMGKGIGNLKTEFFIAYLHACNMKHHNLSQALIAANYVRQALNIGHEPIEMDEFIRGITNLSTADLKLRNP